MDNSGLRHANGEINRLPCVFAEALARGGAVCELAGLLSGTGQRQRKSVLCAHPLARAACAEFDGKLRQKSVFVVRHPAKDNKSSTPAPLTRIHCGGLMGLRDALDPDASAPNIAELLRARQSRFATWHDLPWELIVRAIAAWRPGQRNHARPQA